MYRFALIAFTLCSVAIALSGCAINGGGPTIEFRRAPYSVDSRQPAPTLKPAWQPSEAYVNQFTYAQAHHWSISPILTLHGPPKAIPSTPAGVTPFSDEEKAVVDDVDSIYMENDQFNPNESALAVGEMNNVIEHHPHSAYAELYMSNYYRQRGQAALAQTWLDRSLSDAPTILAGRVVNDRGLPVCNCGLIFSMEANWLWDCPPEQNGQKSTELRYDPVTDANGCFYIPVFPCRLTGVCTAWPCVGESPNALSTYFDGWVFPNRGFLVRGKIGIVKPIVMRRRVQLSLGGTFATGDYASLGNQRNPVSLNGKSMTISWKSCPNATSYVLNFQERGSDGNDDSGPVNTIRVTRLANRAPENELQSFELSLVGKPPFILSHRLYSVEIEARHSLSGVRDPEPALLNESQPIYFIAPGASESLPITKDRIEAAAGSGSIVESIALGDGEATVVTRSMAGPDVWGPSNWTARNLFGYPNVTVAQIIYDSPIHTHGHYRADNSTVVMKFVMKQ